MSKKQTPWAITKDTPAVPVAANPAAAVQEAKQKAQQKQQQNQQKTLTVTVKPTKSNTKITKGVASVGAAVDQARQRQQRQDTTTPGKQTTPNASRRNPFERAKQERERRQAEKQSVMGNPFANSTARKPSAPWAVSKGPQMPDLSTATHQSASGRVHGGGNMGGYSDKASDVIRKYGIDPENFGADEYNRWAAERMQERRNPVAEAVVGLFANKARHRNEREQNGNAVERAFIGANKAAENAALRLAHAAPVADSGGDRMRSYEVPWATNKELGEENAILAALARNNERRVGYNMFKPNAVGAGISAGMSGLALGLPESDAGEKAAYKRAGLPMDRFVPRSYQYEKAREEHPVASTIGDIAGSTASMVATGGIVGEALEGARWFGKLPEFAKHAVSSAITMGTTNGISTGARTGDAQETAKKTVAGALGGAVFGAADYNLNKLGDTLLFNKGWQNKILPEIIKSGIASGGGAAADTAVRAMFGEDVDPSSIATAMAFGAITHGIETIKATKANRAYLDDLNNRMMADYAELVRMTGANRGVAGAEERLVNNILDYNKTMKAWLNGEKGVEIGGEYREFATRPRFVGQDKYVKAITENLDIVSENARNYTTYKHGISEGNTIFGEGAVSDIPVAYESRTPSQVVENARRLDPESGAARSAGLIERRMNEGARVTPAMIERQAAANAVQASQERANRQRLDAMLGTQSAFGAVRDAQGRQANAAISGQQKVINPDSPNPVSQSDKHENAHRTFDLSPETKTELVENLTGANFEAAVQRRIEGLGLSREEATEEVLSNIAEALPYTPNAIDRIERLANNEKSLADRIYNWLKGLTAGDTTIPAGDTFTRKKLAIAQRIMEEGIARASQAHRAGVVPEGGVKYSPIEYDSNGNAYVRVDKDILDGIPEKDWFKTVKTVLRDRFKEGIEYNGNRISVSAKSRGKFTNSDYTRNLTSSEKADKFRMSNNLDEVINTQDNVQNEDPKHPRNDDIVSFDRGAVTVEIGSRAFSVDVLIANKDDGTQQFYDIVNMIPTKIQHTPQTGRSDASTVDRGGNAVSNSSISQSGGGVKKYSRNIPESAEENLSPEAAGELDAQQVSPSQTSDNELPNNASDDSISQSKNEVKGGNGKNTSLIYTNTLQKETFTPDVQNEAERRISEFEYDGVVQKETYEAAQAELARRGADSLIAELANVENQWSADKVAKTLALVMMYQNDGQIEKAVDIISMARENATRSGQASAMWAIVNKLTPAGQLLDFVRQGDKMTEAEIERHPAKEKIKKELAEAKKKDRSRRLKETKEEKGTNETPEDNGAVKEIGDDKPKFTPKTVNKSNAQPEKPESEPPRFVPKADGNDKGTSKPRRSKKAQSIEENKTEAEKVLDKYNIPYLSEEETKQISDTFDMLSKLNDKEDLINLIIKQSKERKTAAHRVVRKALEGQEIKFLKDTALMQVFGKIADRKPSSFAAMVSTYQAMSHLLNGKTMLRNIVSNAVFNTVDRLATDVGFGIDLIQSLFTKQHTVGLDRGIFEKGRLRAQAEGAKKEYLDIALAVDHGDEGSKYALSSAKRTFKGRVFGGLERAMSYGLQVTDEWTKSGIEYNVRKSLERLKNSGFTQEEIDEIAKQEAKYRTFQDKNAISNVLGGLKDTFNIIGIGRTKQFGKFKTHEFGVGDFIQKYTQVPGALIMRGVEYSPTGYAKALYHVFNAAYEAKKGAGYTPQQQRKISMTLGRAMTGTGLIAAFAWLTSMGVMSFINSGTDKKVKQFIQMLGKLDCQINLSALSRWITTGDAGGDQDGDITYTVGFLEPVNTLMSMGAAVWDTVQGRGNVIDLAKAAAAKTFDQILDIPTMTAIKGIFEGVERGDSITDIAVGFLADTATGFIPAPLRQLGNALDDVKRNPYNEDGEIARAIAKIQASIPGLRKGVSAKINPFGEEKITSTGSKALDFLNAFLNPGDLNVYQSKDISEELLRLAEQSTDVLPHVPSTSFKVGDEQFKPRGRDFERYSKLVGTITADMMRAAIKDERYSKLSDDEKIEILSNIATDAEKEAKERFAGVPMLTDTVREKVRSIDVFERNIMDIPGISNTITADKEEYTFKNPEEKAQFRKDIAHGIDEAYRDLLNSASFAVMDDEAKGKALASAKSTIVGQIKEWYVDNKGQPFYKDYTSTILKAPTEDEIEAARTEKSWDELASTEKAAIDETAEGLSIDKVTGKTYIKYDNKTYELNDEQAKRYKHEVKWRSDQRQKQLIDGEKKIEEIIPDLKLGLYANEMTEAQYKACLAKANKKIASARKASTRKTYTESRDKFVSGQTTRDVEVTGAYYDWSDGVRKKILNKVKKTTVDEVKEEMREEITSGEAYYTDPDRSRGTAPAMTRPNTDSSAEGDSSSQVVGRSSSGGSSGGTQTARAGGGRATSGGSGGGRFTPRGGAKGSGGASSGRSSGGGASSGGDSGGAAESSPAGSVVSGEMVASSGRVNPFANVEAAAVGSTYPNPFAGAVTTAMRSPYPAAGRTYPNPFAQAAVRRRSPYPNPFAHA